MSEISALNLESGDVVGGYTLISRLGSGAMGSVWRVHDDGGHIYAMKILRDSLSDDGGVRDSRDPNLKENVPARERLRREALALQKIHNPGVCGIVDMELDDAVAFIVTELIEGKNLKEDVAANGPYVGNDLERLARKLIEAVSAVHAAGIIHRDIKPTNVMISATGPVLVDFGIAMGENESHVTRTGLVMGTPGFIAPEIIDGADSNEATDWWSTASVLAFAATGSPVFGTKPMMAVLERAASGNANLAGLPPNTLAAFRSALNPDPRKRCTSDQLLHAIALDALNPFAWQTSGSDDLFGSTNGADASEVVRPFDVPLPEGMRAPASQAGRTGQTGQVGQNRQSGQAGDTTPRRSAALNRLAQRNQPGNLRADWDTVDADADGTDPGFVAATMALSPEQCTVPLPSDHMGPEQATRPLASPTAGDAASTRVMPAMTTPIETARTAVMPGLAQRMGQGQQTPRQAAQQATQRMPRYAQPVRTGAWPGVRPAPPAAQQQPFPRPMAQAPQPVIRPQQQAQPQPMQPQTQQPQYQANPADIKRGRYLARSTVPLVFAAVIPAVAALFTPLAGPAAALLLFWVLLTVGFSTESQLEREGKRGGRRKGSDTAVRILQLPWHLVRAACHALLRTVLFMLIDVIVIVIAVLALHLPWQMVFIGDIWPHQLPYLVDGPFTLTGLTVACAAAGTWMLTAFWPKAPILRLGAGVLTGGRAGRDVPSPAIQSS